jgi:hypothetical protein
VVVQPAGAVIASLFRNVTWASMSDPVATEAGRVTVTDVAFVAVLLAQPPPGQAATSAIGSMTYGSGRSASLIRSCSHRVFPARSRD